MTLCPHCWCKFRLERGGAGKYSISMLFPYHAWWQIPKYHSWSARCKCLHICFFISFSFFFFFFFLMVRLGLCRKKVDFEHGLFSLCLELLRVMTIAEVYTTGLESPALPDSSFAKSLFDPEAAVLSRRLLIWRIWCRLLLQWWGNLSSVIVSLENFLGHLSIDPPHCALLLPRSWIVVFCAVS